MFREERSRFYKELSKNKNIKVIPSQANYFMIKILRKKTARELTKDLLIKYNIFIKDLTNKTNNKNYIRVAIRNFEDNNKLISALKEIL